MKALHGSILVTTLLGLILLGYACLKPNGYALLAGTAVMIVTTALECWRIVLDNRD